VIRLAVILVWQSIVWLAGSDTGQQDWLWYGVVWWMVDSCDRVAANMPAIGWQQHAVIWRQLCWLCCGSRIGCDMHDARAVGAMVAGIVAVFNGYSVVWLWCMAAAGLAVICVCDTVDGWWMVVIRWMVDGGDTVDGCDKVARWQRWQ
jgi:hypothetical protein